MRLNPNTAVAGVGIDLIEVSRIAGAMEDPAFASHVLTDSELRADATPEWLSGRWAAKEAVAKAVGVDLGWHDVEILDDEAKPGMLGTPWETTDVVGILKRGTLRNHRVGCKCGRWEVHDEELRAAMESEERQLTVTCRAALTTRPAL